MASSQETGVPAPTLPPSPWGQCRLRSFLGSAWLLRSEPLVLREGECWLPSYLVVIPAPAAPDMAQIFLFAQGGMGAGRVVLFSK